MYQRLFMVEMGNIHVITSVTSIGDQREKAKRQAHNWIGGDKDRYIVSPLTDEGDRIHLDITLRMWKDYP